jgi:hypothetical protein
MPCRTRGQKKGEKAAYTVSVPQWVQAYWRPFRPVHRALNKSFDSPIHHFLPHPRARTADSLPVHECDDGRLCANRRLYWIGINNIKSHRSDHATFPDSIVPLRSISQDLRKPRIVTRIRSGSSPKANLNCYRRILVFRICSSTRLKK